MSSVLNPLEIEIPNNLTLVLSKGDYQMAYSMSQKSTLPSISIVCYLVNKDVFHRYIFINQKTRSVKIICSLSVAKIKVL